MFNASPAINRLSNDLESGDFSESDIFTGEDHAVHAAGRTCMRCGHVIEANQAARLRGSDDWVHDTCPPSSD
jgi:hypothetical protein